MVGGVSKIFIKWYRDIRYAKSASHPQKTPPSRASSILRSPQYKPGM